MNELVIVAIGVKHPVRLRHEPNNLCSDARWEFPMIQYGEFPTGSVTL